MGGAHADTRDGVQRRRCAAARDVYLSRRRSRRRNIQRLVCNERNGRVSLQCSYTRRNCAGQWGSPDPSRGRCHSEGAAQACVGGSRSSAERYPSREYAEAVADGGCDSAARAGVLQSSEECRRHREPYCDEDSRPIRHTSGFDESLGWCLEIRKLDTAPDLWLLDLGEYRFVQLGDDVYLWIDHFCNVVLHAAAEHHCDLAWVELVLLL